MTTLNVLPTKRLAGVVKAPASKSYTHRAVMTACLGRGGCVVNPLSCDDTRSTIAIWRKLGARVRRDGDRLVITGVRGHPKPSGHTVNVGESGTLLRFILSALALVRGRVRVEGRGSLLRRTNRQVVDVLRSWGVRVAGRGVEHTLPIEIDGEGVLPGGEARVEGGVTSQVVSSLLIAAPFARRDTVLRLRTKLVSRPYVDITLDVLRWSGVRVRRRGCSVFRVSHGQAMAPRAPFVVHGDYSAAAFLLAAACLVPSDVTVTDLADDCQGDRRFLRIIEAMGAKVERRGDAVRIRGPFEMKGVDIDGSDIPDLVPVMAALGCFAHGATRVRNVAHLAHKESNRLAAPAAELGKLGARISFDRDSLLVLRSRLHGGSASSCNDHRLAMALAVAALGAGVSVRIAGAECIAKSYPRFAADMRRLGARLV